MRGERAAQHIDIVFLLVSYVIVTTTLIHLASICSEEFDGKVYDMIVYMDTLYIRGKCIIYTLAVRPADGAVAMRVRHSI